MNRKILLSSLAVVVLLSGCGKNAAPQETAAPAVPSAQPETVQAAPGRQDGERFEDVIILEGTEEPVKYEHVRNETLGFELDYDYESLSRNSEADRERFVSIYDDAQDPWNYLEVTRSTADTEAAAAAVSEALSAEYEVSRESITLERAGACIRLGAYTARDGGLPAQIQTVYIIPAPDGCRIAAAHCAMEAAEGFGRRFDYMMQTFSVIA